MGTQAVARVVGPADGVTHDLGGGLGARLLVAGGATADRCSLVDHPMAPRTLGSPVHTHAREDEYSYVLEGTVTVLVGEEIVVGRPGDLILKPRGVKHAFWNATDEPARLLELISPAGFEQFFVDIEPIFAVDGEPDWDAFMGICETYGLEMDLASAEDLMVNRVLADNVSL